MGLGDAMNKAKDFAQDNPNKVNQGIDAAGDQAKSRVGEQHADSVDKGTDAAKKHLNGDQGGNAKN